MRDKDPSREKMLHAQIESERLRRINPNLAAECPFCNFGEESKRGILRVGRDNPIFGGHYEPPSTSYICGVGRNSCGVLQMYTILKSYDKI